ncbi:MAG: hypothetical protein EXR77_12055 [Myxococcales bacterium]|nr:hypothetical protein [Myxococcales bacterium]
MFGFGCGQSAGIEDSSGGATTFLDLGSIATTDSKGADSTGDAKSAGDGKSTGELDTDANSTCVEGTTRCTGNSHEKCTQSAWKAAPCDTKAPVCLNGTCVACLPGKKKCGPLAAGSSTTTKVEQCGTSGTAWTLVETCTGGGICLDGSCAACKPGSAKCAQGKKEMCAEGGKGWQPAACPSDQPVCVKGNCYACAPSQPFCAEPEPSQVTPTVVMQCDSTGESAAFLENCTAPQACYAGACRICIPAETRCKGATGLETCSEDGQSWDLADCPTATSTCHDGKCMVCKPNSSLCGPKLADGSPSVKVLKCSAAGDKAAVKEVCGGSLVCTGGKCAVCAADYPVCLQDVVLGCTADGGDWLQSSSCGVANVPCAQGGCGCAPDQTLCAPPPVGTLDSHKIATCNATGSAAVVTKACAEDGVCDGGVCLPCKAGAVRCLGQKALECKADSSGWQVLEDCAATGKFCAGGGCRDLCDPEQPNASNWGCEFWATSLPNAAVADPTVDVPIALIITNPSAAKLAKVKVDWTDATGAVKSKQIDVAAKGQTVVQVPVADWGAVKLQLQGSQVGAQAVRVTSDAPIAVMQHNPASISSAPSADASILLPVNALGKAYVAVGRPQTILDEPAFLTVVAATAGATKVTLQLTDKAVAGSGVAAIKPGVPIEIAISQGQVLHLETGAVGADFTGSIVSADKPIAVFSGNRAAHVPASTTCIFAPNTPAGTVGQCKVTAAACLADVDCPQVCCADHLEDQLPPTTSWGTTHVVAALQLRDPQSKEFVSVRIVAGQDQTTVATIPQQTAPVTLAKGAFIDLETKADFVVVSSKPVLVAQFMTSAQTIGVGANDQGDPMMQIVPPVSRFAPQMVFAPPTGYGSLWINVAFQAASSVSLDGSALAPTATIEGTDWSIARKSIGAGVHTLEATWPIGATVYGWSKGVSFGAAVGYGLP